MPCPQALFEQFLETALWAETDSDGEPLDRNYAPDDFAPSALTVLRADCDSFYESNQDLIDRYDYSQCGHDFWLTRNGHGAGFWDGDYPKEDGELLTIACKKFGEVWLVVGDDGLIYC